MNVSNKEYAKKFSIFHCRYAQLVVFMLLLFAAPVSIEARSGCCSYHGDVAGCSTDGKRVLCNDGTYSPTCTCESAGLIKRKHTPSSTSTLSPLLKRPYNPTQSIDNYKGDQRKGHEGQNEVIRQIRARNAYEDLFPSVYLNGYDRHYHTEHCEYIKLNRKKLSLITAHNQRYTPCSKCSPPKIEKYAHLIKKNPPKVTRKYVQKSSPVTRKKIRLNRCVDKDGQLVVTPHACSSLGLKNRILTNADLHSSGGSFNIISSAGNNSSGRIVTTRSSDRSSEKLSISSAGIDRRIGEYFRKANENVGALNCSVRKTERDVSQSLKNKVKARDGHKCVICGSAHKLEVDHIRALMNGGSNDILNLATLCDDCHTKKTRMDNSLKRKRRKICKH